VPYLAVASPWKPWCRWSTARSIRAEFPAGQWDYQFFYEESFDRPARASNPASGKRREGAVSQGRFQGGGQTQPHCVGPQEWRLFGGAAFPMCHAIPTSHEQDMEAYTAALTRNGFFGPDSWS